MQFFFGLHTIDLSNRGSQPTVVSHLCPIGSQLFPFYSRLIINQFPTCFPVFVHVLHVIPAYSVSIPTQSIDLSVTQVVQQNIKSRHNPLFLGGIFDTLYYYMINLSGYNYIQIIVDVYPSKHIQTFVLKKTSLIHLLILGYPMIHVWMEVQGAYPRPPTAGRGNEKTFIQPATEPWK